MKRRMTIAGTALGARLAAICGAAVTLLAALAVSACTANSTSTPTVTLTPTITGGTVTATASAGTTATPGVPAGSVPTTTATVTRTAQVATPDSSAPTATATVTVYPSGAPAAGGGGTAGLQDGTLFVVGGTAVLAGVGTIAYRRRLTRNR